MTKARTPPPSNPRRHPRIGAHESVAQGLSKAFERIESVGGEALQIFTKNNTRWESPPLDPEEVQRFRLKAAAFGPEFILVHDIYLINLASPEEAAWTKSKVHFLDEIQRCDQLGLPWLVMHPGSHKGTGTEPGIERIARALDDGFKATPDSGVTVLLENTAGQGDAIGRRFEELKGIIDRSAFPSRLGVCFDTCHAYAAGYDLATPEGYDATFREFDAVLGLDRLKAFHLNDSKKGLASRVDRHDHIGQGLLGLEPFRRLLNDPRFRDRPMVLETPKGDDLEEDRTNLRVLRGLLA